MPHLHDALIISAINRTALVYGKLTNKCLSQVGYFLDTIGEFGNPADLRRDARVLAEQVQQIVSEHDGQQYKSLQQAGMRSDTSWELPAQQWEQVLVKADLFAIT